MRIPRISTRGYYNKKNGKKIKDNKYDIYPKKYFDKLNDKEIVIMIHGMHNDKKDALSKFHILNNKLQKLKYNYPVIIYTYDADVDNKKNYSDELHVAQLIANNNGINLAKFIVDFKQKNKTKIRLLGHSLGSEIILKAIEILGKNYKKYNIESIHFFGASIKNITMHDDNHIGKIFYKTVKKIKNYYCPNDEILETAIIDGLKPIGLYGTTKKTITNYYQKKVYPKSHKFADYLDKLNKFP